MTGCALMMKRRTLCDGGVAKPRRPVGLGIKKTKLTDGFYSSAWLYAKFLLVWAIVLTADFVLEFRFEFLWPVWLLMRSTFDSFRYQGLAFSVLFVCVSLTSDVICYLFVPVQWLFLAASTYVWVQYVWHTDRGLCLLNFFLLLLFFGMETSSRLRDIKCFPFHWDLCRPFAAHCIGYPVVTLGFGCKSYISYKLRLRKQAEIQRQNEKCYKLLGEALPIDLATISQDEAISLYSSSNGSVPSPPHGCGAPLDLTPRPPPGGGGTGGAASLSATRLADDSAGRCNIRDAKEGKSSGGGDSMAAGGGALASVTALMDSIDLAGPARANGGPAASPSATNVNDYRPPEENASNDTNAKVYKATAKNNPHLGGTVAKTVVTVTAVAAGAKEAGAIVKNGVAGGSKEGVLEAAGGGSASAGGATATTKNNLVVGAGVAKSSVANALTKKKSNNTSNKDDAVIRLELEVKRVRADLQASRNSEQELRLQINALTTDDRASKAEVYQLRQDNESLQSKLHNLVTSRQQDKQTLATLERKLAEERKQRAALEQQLASERKRKQDEMATARSAPPPVRMECSESCKNRRAELENEVKQIGWELKHRTEHMQQLENETKMLRQYKEAQSESEVLMSALMAMRDKNAHLENNLSAETRLKMDLFSALGDAKRQFEIQHGLLMQREAEVADLKTKVAEVMALVPSTSGFGSICTDSPPHFSSAFAMVYIPPGVSPLGAAMAPQMGGGVPPSPPNSPPSSEMAPLSKSNLNPHASDYQPKNC